MNNDELIECPKCGSTQITANKKGYSFVKGAAGAVLTGGIGLVAGFHGSNKIKVQCLKCGFKWKPGEHNKSSKGRTIAPSESEDYQRKLERFRKIRSSGQVEYATKYALESGLVMSKEEADSIYESKTHKSDSEERSPGLGCMIAAWAAIAVVLYFIFTAIF